jgi:hypothetical protein
VVVVVVVVVVSVCACAATGESIASASSNPLVVDRVRVDLVIEWNLLVALAFGGMTLTDPRHNVTAVTRLFAPAGIQSRTAALGSFSISQRGTDGGHGKNRAGRSA